MAHHWSIKLYTGQPFVISLCIGHLYCMKSIYGHYKDLFKLKKIGQSLTYIYITQTHTRDVNNCIYCCYDWRVTQTVNIIECSI